MTLADFYKITKAIGNYETEWGLNIPNAVCVSRKIYNDLIEDFKKQKSLEVDTERYAERVFGLALFVDDDMPDDFYCVGQAKIFIDTLARKQKTKRIDGQ